MELTSGQKRDLLARGFAKVPGAVKRSRLDAALREINHMVGQERNPARARPSGGPNGYNDDYWTEMMSTPAVMSLLNDTPAWGLGESLLGRGMVQPDTRAQIALRFPTLRDEPSEPRFHVDNLYYPTNEKPQPPGKFESFTLLIYVILNDIPKENSGNFTVCPGSHRLISGHIRRHGLASLREGRAKIELPPSEQVTGKAGDLVLCHYLTAHDRQLNFSPNIRYAAFFRLKHAEHEARQARVLSDLWLEWPAIRRIARTP